MANVRRPDPSFYRRRLPHWQPLGSALFLTWRLYGSLPQAALLRLQDERRALAERLPREGEDARDRALREGKRLFAIADELCGMRREGPLWLQEERTAELVTGALFFHDGKLYTLDTFVVMPNHVHVLLWPAELPGSAGQVPLSRITQALKGYTGREANKLLGRTGRAFWQDESYDHCARDEAELGRIQEYIESDPVRSMLVGEAGEWRWSSAWERACGRMREGKMG